MGAFAVLVFVCSCMVCTIHSTESAARVYRSGSTSAQGCARSSLARARANLAKRPAGRQGPTNRRNRDLRAIPADLKIPTPTCHVLFCELELRTSIVRPRIDPTNVHHTIGNIIHFDRKFLGDSNDSSIDTGGPSTRFRFSFSRFLLETSYVSTCENSSRTA